MQYKEIVSVTGLGGLFHLLSTKSDGAIVRSLADNATKFIPSRLHNVTPLESIEIYTTGPNVRLHEVLQQMKDSTKTLPSAKADAAEIRNYFKEVYPDMDDDRVYTSDMKKMLKWFEILKGADLLDFSAMYPTAEEAETNETEVAAEVSEAKPAKKSSKKATEASEKTTAANGEADEVKPAKKATAKKKSTEATTDAEAEKKVAKPKKKAE
ncbi:MAG: DUF5606 domain-containing protein [Bacteroidetes bacterium]|nr:DUF5606 domain-containing protein [Bacteroidota bacterium]